MVSACELKKQILFEDIGDDDLKKLEKSVELLTLKKGEQLFAEKDETKGIFMVKAGKIEISKVTADGWKQTLAILGPQHFFGEISIMEHRNHEAFAFAQENSELYLLSKADFDKMQKEDPALAFQVIKKIALVMSKNLRRMNDKFLNALINY